MEVENIFTSIWDDCYIRWRMGIKAKQTLRKNNLLNILDGIWWEWYTIQQEFQPKFLLSIKLTHISSDWNLWVEKWKLRLLQYLLSTHLFAFWKFVYTHWFIILNSIFRWLLFEIHRIRLSFSEKCPSVDNRVYNVLISKRYCTIMHRSHGIILFVT